MIITNRIQKNKLYDKIRNIFYNMEKRCYNTKSKYYKNYGAKGITVCDKWRNLNGFIEDIDKIKGFDLELFMSGNLSLDKDSLEKNNKIYCLEKCCFISKSENNKYKPNQQKHFIGIDPFGIEHKGLNQSEFARTHNLPITSISNCLRNKSKHIKMWKFYYSN